MPPRTCDVEAGTRTCGSCGESRPATSEFFHKRSRSPDGYHSRCKACAKTENATYRTDNLERLNAYGTVWRAANPEYNREHYAANTEKDNARNAAWRANNPERLKVTHAVHRRRLRVAEGSFTREEVETLLVNQGNLCAYCGEELKIYHLDHVKPISKGGSNYIRNIVAACPLCNMSKGDKLLGEWQGRAQSTPGPCH